MCIGFVYSVICYYIPNFRTPKGTLLWSDGLEYGREKKTTIEWSRYT